MAPPPFATAPGVQEAITRTLAEGIATADRYGLDLTSWEVRELEPRTALLQLRFALRALFTWNDVTKPATAAPDVKAIYDAVEAATLIRGRDTRRDLFAALDRYDAAVARS